jgi:hypothetical protein
MSTASIAKRKPKMVGLDKATRDEAFEAAMGALKKTPVPENSSRRTTVSGPVAAAVKCGKKLKNYLY